jgi:ArsR family transcriptional regulator
MEGVAGHFKLVADPTRVLMLCLLLRHDLSVSDLASMLDLSQPTVSAHMKQLREAGLLDSRKVGTATLYRASRERVEGTFGEALDRLMSTAAG